MVFVLDNTVVERFFGNLKNEWVLNVHTTKELMKQGGDAYIRYYNQESWHTTFGNLILINYEKLQS